MSEEPPYTITPEILKRWKLDTILEAMHPPK